MSAFDKSIAQRFASTSAVRFSTGCAIIFAMLGAAIWASWQGKFGALIKPDWGSSALLFLSGLGFVLFLFMSIGFWKPVREERLKYRADFEKGEVEILTVHTGRVCILDGDHSSREPALCFDLGDERLLVLVGPWIRDHARYLNSVNEPAPRTDRDWEEYFNELPPPWAFPSTQFQLKRLPQSGYVLSITSMGPYLKPEDAWIGFSSKDARGYRESQILRGSMEQISLALGSIPGAITYPIRPSQSDSSSV